MRDYIKCRVRSLNAPLEGLIGDQVFFTIKQFNNVPLPGAKKRAAQKAALLAKLRLEAVG